MPQVNIDSLLGNVLETHRLHTAWNNKWYIKAPWWGISV